MIYNNRDFILGSSLEEPSIPKWQHKTPIWRYGWVVLKRGPLTLWCDNMYTFSRCRIKVDHQPKQPHSKSIIPLTTFFNCFTNLTALAHASKSITLDCMSNNFFQRESLCKCEWHRLYFDFQCQEYKVFNISNLLQSTTEWQHSKHAYYW